MIHRYEQYLIHKKIVKSASLKQQLHYEPQLFQMEASDKIDKFSNASLHNRK